VRVIDQARLWFREGASDKVYEVDLVEVAPNQHVVNFRFGRRGSALRDGTKTATPVTLAKARTIFEKLVAEKTAGGYQAGAVPPAATAPAARAAAATTPPRAPAVADDPDSRLVARLLRGNRGDDALGPHVWRAADRDLAAAEPALRELLDAPPPRGLDPVPWQHSLAGAFVRCGTAASLARLEKIANDARTRPHVRDVARLAIVRIDPARALELARPGLPPPLRAALDRRDPDELAHAAEELLGTDPARAHAAAVSLYLIDTAALPAAAPGGSPYRAAGRPAGPGAGPAGTSATGASVARAAILAIARIARLSNAEAAIVRALFRLAELRRDPELYARLAVRIDAYTGTVRPFGPRTRQYFRRRVARVLRRLARAASPDYVPMASAVLRSVTDADAQAPRTDASGTVHYDRFARFHALNDILYGQSPRYERAHHKRSVWQCRGRYRPGDPAPARREERYTALWDRAPEALWRLLVDAGNLPTVAFAARALRDHRAYLDTLADEVLAPVLAGGHPVAQQLVFDTVRDRPLTITLARAALASDLADAHAWVLRWIDQHPAQAAGDPELLALLVTGKTAAMREAGLAILRGRALAAELARSVAARALAILLGFPGPETAPAPGAAPGTETPNDRAAAAAAILLRVLEAPLAQISAEVLHDLIRHPLAALGELAGELMLRHARRDHLPAELVEALLQSPHATVRALGGRLLALTPPEIAKDDVEALVLFSTSANRELREATRTLIGEVARRYPDVGRALADRLIDALLARQPDGTPAHVVSLLHHELAACLPHKPAAAILKLISALSPHAREAGGLLLPQLGPDDLGLDDITRLASHEILAIRQGAWTLARAALPRFRVAPVAIAKLVDSGWDDTRAFAVALIHDELGTLSADAIIAICDSIRPEVQAIGKELLLARFQTADAGRYVVRLAEHPSVSIQLLVSGMLEHHVAGQLDRLRALAPYLITVLSQVNRGKVAKERVIQLLGREATRSAEAAAIVAPILDRQSATAAITQKHPLIATMVDVAAAFPGVALPITVIPPAAHPRTAEPPRPLRPLRDDEAAP
jgi:WGR domain